MELKKVDITKEKALEKQAKELYLAAFPKEERIPWWLLRLNACRKGIDLTAFMEDERFCGFTSSVTVGKLHFLLFFAVSEKYRGQGYGSEILADIRREHPTIALNVEPLEESAPNYSERVKRFDFYRKNGFADTGYHVWEIGGMFRVLSTEAELNVVQYQKIFQKLTCGLWKVKIRRAV